MNSTKIIPFLIFFSCIFFLNGKSQSSLDDFNFQVYYQTTSTDTAIFIPLCNRICKVTVSNTVNLASVLVEVGTSEDDSDIINYEFLIDNTTGLPTGLTFLREENIIYLGLLQTTQSDMYYYKVTLKDNSGNLSEPKRWN